MKVLLQPSGFGARPDFPHTIRDTSGASWPMAIKISKKIKGYSVAKPDDKTAEAAAVAAQNVHAPAHTDVLELPVAEVIQMHERLDRPEMLIGSTYKIKSPLVEHALYVTINDIVLNADTPFESRRPFEIFINSKNMDHFQWVVAITRIMSAVFRKGGDVTFLVEEMKAVFDPRGGYFKAGGVYMPSIVAEIGAVVEDHLKHIGMIVDDEISPEKMRMIVEKRAAYEARSAKKKSEITNDFAGAGAEAARKHSDKNSPSSVRGEPSPVRGEPSPVRGEPSPVRGEPSPVRGEPVEPQSEAQNGYPPGATMCLKCNTKATIIMDGCATCLSCGYSKCG